MGAFWNLKRAFDLWILTYSGSKLELLETHHEVGTLCPSGTLHPRLSAANPHLVSSRPNSHWTVLSAWDPPDCEAAPVTEYRITSPVPRTLRRSQGGARIRETVPSRSVLKTQCRPLHMHRWRSWRLCRWRWRILTMSCSECA